MPEKFDFSTGYERAIVSALFRYESFTKTFLNLIEPDLFNDPIHREIVGYAISFARRYNTLPQFSDFENEWRGTGGNELKVLERLRLLRKLKVKDRLQALSDNLTGFFRMRAVEDGLRKSREIMADNRGDEVERVLDLFEGVKQIGDMAESEPLALMTEAGLAERVTWHNKERHRRHRTGFVGIDKFIRGGVDQGELLVIIGGTNIGKSHAGVHCGAACALRGLKVIHFSVEMSRFQIARRYDARIGMKAAERIYGQDMGLRTLGKKYGKILAKGGSVLIEDFKKYDERGRMSDVLARRPKVSDLKSVLVRLEASTGFIPDIAIVDMADHLGAERTYTDERFATSEVYASLRRLGGEFGLPVITMSHITRSSQRSNIVDLTDISEDINKARIADIILALCQTRKEEERGVLRVHVAKNREGPKGQVVEYMTEFAHSYFRPMISVMEIDMTTQLV